MSQPKNPRLTKDNRLPLCDDVKTKHAASVIGRKGGRATGPNKARSSDHYRTIAKAYWEKRRAFMVTFHAMSDQDKAELFNRHGLTGQNQTLNNLWPLISHD